MPATPPPPPMYIGGGGGGDGGEDRHTQTPDDDTAATPRTPPGGIITRAFGCGASWHPANPALYGYIIARHAAEAADNEEPAHEPAVPIPDTPFFTDCSLDDRELRIQWYRKQMARRKALNARTSPKT